MITDDQKRALWAMHEPTILWALGEGPLMRMVPRGVQVGAAAESFIIVYDPKRIAADYRAPASCSLPADDPYVVERGGLDKLVWIRGQADRTAHEYVIPKEQVRAVCDVYEGSVITLDWDIVFTDDQVITVARSNGNGGIFSGCEVHEIPSEQAWNSYRRWRDGAGSQEDHLLHEVMDFYVTRIQPNLQTQTAR